MNRIRIMLLASVAALAALVVVVAAQAATPTLNGTVGPGFTITLTQGGKKVTALKAGTYTFKIVDKSAQHNFHLTGPGVNKKTSVAALSKYDVDDQAGEGHLQVRLRPARVVHEGQLQGQLSGSATIARPSIRNAASSSRATE